MANGVTSSLLSVFILCTILTVAVSHAARLRKLGEAEETRRNLLNNGLGHTPQMG